MRKVLASLLTFAVIACTERPLQTARDMPPPPLPGGAPPAVPTGGAPALPTGYGARPVSNRLEDPRALVFDQAGRPLLLEGAPARLSRVEADGGLSPLAQGGGNGPWTGAAATGGRIFVAESGGALGGRILEVGPDGGLRPLPVKLPGGGLVGPLAAGPDGWLHVGVASAAAAGGSQPDIPCHDRRVDGRRVEGEVPCTGAVIRLHPDDGSAEVHSWGWRAPTALGFAPDGRLLVADRDQGGSALHRAVAGVWYGWPDSQLAAADPAATDLPNPPPAPLTGFDGDAAAIAATDHRSFGGPDETFMALPDRGVIAFAAIEGGPPVPFAANLRKPQALAFSPAGDEMWVADAATGTLWLITPTPAPASWQLPPAAPSATSVANRWRPPAWKIGARADGAVTSP